MPNVNDPKLAGPYHVVERGGATVVMSANKKVVCASIHARWVCDQLNVAWSSNQAASAMRVRAEEL